MTVAKRVIKKYPNRRLYDTEVSRYITLEDIKQLVLRNIIFEVLDAKTQEDLTNSTLLQIIMELEQQGAPIFTTAMLQQFIRFYGQNYQNIFGEFLEKTLSMFKEQPAQTVFQNLSAQQMQLWQQWQEFFRGK
jgi:polyhydroxyalkanoate synthesis repressor PhaR